MSVHLGYLVVCLPHPFEGGILEISKQGHLTVYDWSNTGNHILQWAAFVDGCDQELDEVKAGNRITLKYDLSITQRVGGIFQPVSIVDARGLPLYAEAKAMLEQPGFMKNGKLLNFLYSLVH